MNSDYTFVLSKIESFSLITAEFTLCVVALLYVLMTMQHLSLLITKKTDLF